MSDGAHPALPGRPFTLPHFKAWSSQCVLDDGERFAIQPFQESFVRDLFRGYRECWLVVPEGNGKTTLIAILALYHLRFRAGAAVSVAAASREQAELTYSQAAAIVAATPGFPAVFKCQEGYRRIRCFETGGRLQIKAADERTGDGIIPTLCLVDELHRHRSLALYRTWVGKLKKRAGAKIVAISTAGEPGSEFELTRERIRQNGKARRRACFTRAETPRLVLHEWAVPEKGDVTDFRLVKRANPLSTITVESLEDDFHSDSMTIGHWRRFVCNLPTRSEFAAITEQEWAAATVDELPEGEPIWAGLDLAFKWDTTALVPLWESEGVRTLGDASILVPPRDGSMLESGLIEQAIITLHHRNPIHTVVMDVSKGETLAQWIESEIGATVIDWSQGLVTQASEYERFMQGLRDETLRHTGDPGLKEHVMNAIARRLPGGDHVFDRPSQSRRDVQEQRRRVIDALKAAAMVNCACADQPEVLDEPLVAFG